MSAVTAKPPEHAESSWRTLRRGLAFSPELRTGLIGTFVLAVVATVGRMVVPVAIQQGIDRGLQVAGGPDLGVVGLVVALTAGAIAMTMFCAYWMSVRLIAVSEVAVARLRTRVFRRIHDLSMLRQQGERRGSLVSRVTTDVDQVSEFLQWGGMLLLVLLGQILVTVVIMLTYSWQLTLAVLIVFIPFMFAMRSFQTKLSDAYLRVRESVGVMLAAVSESVVGALVIRAYGVQRRTLDRLDTAVEANRRIQMRANVISVYAHTAGEFTATIATVVVVSVGTILAVGMPGALGSDLTVGKLTAFLFLVALLVTPVQVLTEEINETQNAIAGWRRVLDVLDIAPDVADPGERGRELPAGPLSVRFKEVSFAYAGGPEVLGHVTLEVQSRKRVAVVGESGSGKTTFARLLTRLMDPSRGVIELSGVPLREVTFASLRRRVAIVPQDGFLFDTTVADNIRFGRPDMSDEAVRWAVDELGLGDWVDELPAGLATSVGERGEALSVGERQLVALARAYVADPDLLVLDEATSAVDPVTEVRLQHALDTVTLGRTTVTIAHRLSMVESADEVIVVDAGRVVQQGAHAELIAMPNSAYRRLYASWLEQTRAGRAGRREDPS